MLPFMSRTVIAVDIGGTNARFALARIVGAGDEALRLDHLHRYRVADHPGLESAWQAFARDVGTALPDMAAVAVAGPVDRVPIRLTNSPWVVDPTRLKAALGLRQLVLVNDFAAIAHGVTALPPNRLRRLFGPSVARTEEGVLTVLGPGTGLGVAMVVQEGEGGPHILSTEGGHIGFAAADAEEDRLLAALRRRFGRVSAERIVSGPGLAALCAVQTPQNPKGANEDDADLWRQALTRQDSRPRAALRRLILGYGAVAGDLALAHGAAAVVLAGGLTGRMIDDPLFAGFQARFLDKGRHRALLERVPVFYADHPELGVFGAAVAGLAARPLADGSGPG